MYRARHRALPFVLAAVVFVLGALILFIARPGHHDSSSASLSAADQQVAHGAGTVRAAARPQAAAPRRSATLQTARGVVTLRGPQPAVAGIHVVFSLQGPRTVVKSLTAAPWLVRIDTRTLPNGVYRLRELVARPGAKPTLSSRLLRIANPAGSHPPVAPSPTTPVTPPTTPAAPAPRPTVTASAPAAPVPPPTTAAPAPSAPGMGSFAAQVLTLTNQQRATAGCAPLTANSILTSVAQAHSQDMATNNYFDHNSPNGQTPFDRMKAAGYQFSTAGENIAAGQQTPQAVMTAWMNSPGHKANILNCSFKEIGVGYATGGSYGSYWTQDFGTKL